MSDLMDQLMRLTGHTPDELHELGGKAYPEENNLNNQGGHRLASKLMTDRFGPIASQLAGVGSEIFEAGGRWAGGAPVFDKRNREDTMGDFAANWRGAKDSMKEQAAPALEFLRGLGIGR